MKNLLLILMVFILKITHSQTNTCQGTFTFGAGPCQRIIIGNGTPGQIRVCLDIKNIPIATGGNKCNPGGLCNPPFNGGGWNPGIYIFNSNSSGTNYAGAMQEDWQSDATIGCYTLTLSTGYAVLFGLCNINGTQISWTTIDACNQNACLGPPCSPLPVELVNFECKNENDYNVIKWSTASENNSSHFILKTSTDGINYRVVLILPSAGNSNQLISYKAIHYDFDKVINYYALEQFDLDGAYKIYGPISSDNRVEEIKKIRTINMLGQEVDENYKGIFIIQYSDGTFEKKYIPN
jgi:hypothetical protein